MRTIVQAAFSQGIERIYLFGEMSVDIKPFDILSIDLRFFRSNDKKIRSFDIIFKF